MAGNSDECSIGYISTSRQKDNFIDCSRHVYTHENIPTVESRHAQQVKSRNRTQYSSLLNYRNSVSDRHRT
jgi:hypothetical protein